jgi:hypothetical protein
MDLWMTERKRNIDDTDLLQQRLKEFVNFKER